MLGDVIGAVVEGESPRYIRKTFKTVDDLIALDSVEEILGRRWLVGRFTDDTQMSLCVAEWLLGDAPNDGEDLFARFADAYRPGRVLEAFPEHLAEWRSLATLRHGRGL